MKKPYFAKKKQVFTVLNIAQFSLYLKKNNSVYNFYLIIQLLYNLLTIKIFYYVISKLYNLSII